MSLTWRNLAIPPTGSLGSNVLRASDFRLVLSYPAVMVSPTLQRLGAPSDSTTMDWGGGGIGNDVWLAPARWQRGYGLPFHASSQTRDHQGRRTVDPGTNASRPATR